MRVNHPPLKRFCLAALVLVACDARSTRPAPVADSGVRDAESEGGSGEGGGGEGGAPTCADGTAIAVEQDGAELATVDSQASGQWTVVDRREVFRVRLVSSHNPIPEAIDDEFAIVTLIDVVPSALLEQRELPGPIAQRIETDQFGSSIEPPQLDVTNIGEHSGAIHRVLMQSSGFGTNPAPTVYEVRGRLAIEQIRDRRFRGTLTLDVEGRIEGAFGDAGTLHIEACFEFTVPSPSSCLPGESCGNDCIAEDEWVCWSCGTLYLTHDCECRPDIAPLAECQSAEPAARGELCGEQWWCNRQCAEGLQCTPDPEYGDEGSSDAGVDVPCFYATCQAP